ncbi:MAG: site-2 protease family protein [Candidatus Saccharicenans sp.]|jgi:membrane-associated protease RseP (regulator of RpoE activity)|nr:site-2 protease family protein [Candidatus Saccharicenans sp.]MDH7574489.1 site-2 protease family protein [Candidatus Saccharicenans sp.]
MLSGKRWLNLVLFILTILSTYFVGYLWGINYLWAGQDPNNISGALSLSLFLEPALIKLSLIYSISLLVILLGHELGHYLTCRRYRVQASLPFFIPAPTLIGTLGAFIRIKSPLARREELFDVGANGPLTGFLLSVPALYAGLQLSRLIPALPRESSILFGEPLLLKLFVRLTFGPVAQNQDLILHPLAVAGWVGLLVTSFNLFPVGQLDGGHILYALFGEKMRRLAPGIILILLVLGIFYWAGWLIWAVLISVMGLRHPAVADSGQRFSRKRIFLSLAVALIFVLSFIPAPISGNSLLDLLK